MHYELFPPSFLFCSETYYTGGAQADALLAYFMGIAHCIASRCEKITRYIVAVAVIYQYPVIPVSGNSPP